MIYSETIIGLVYVYGDYKFILRINLFVRRHPNRLKGMCEKKCSQTNQIRWKKAQA